MAGPEATLPGGLTGRSAGPSLRPAASPDAAALADLDALVNPNPWSAAQFVQACVGSSAERALVLELEARTVGFVVYSLVLDEVCIHSIAVHPCRHREGLGGTLLRAALATARAAGAGRCYLEVRASNKPARALYTRYGFQVDGRRKDYYPLAEGREDALLMSRQL